MMRRFVENGWRFEVEHRNLSDWTSSGVTVRFYDDSLRNPELEDLFKVTVPMEKEVEETVEKDFLGLYSWETTETKTVERELEDVVEEAMEKAWEKIEEIDETPSERFHNAIERSMRTKDD